MKNEINTLEIRQRLNQLIQKSGLSSYKLGKLANISKQALSSLQLGKAKNFRLSTGIGLAENLDITLHELVFGEKPQLPVPPEKANDTIQSLLVVEWNQLLAFHDAFNSETVSDATREQFQYVYSKKLFSGEVFGAKVGTQLMPLFAQDTIFILAPYPFYKNKDLVVLSKNGSQPTLSKVVREKTKLFLANPFTEKIEDELGQDQTIFGLVLEVWHDPKQWVIEGVKLFTEES